MKKTALTFISIVLLTGSALASGFRLELKGSYFTSENQIFRDVYGSAPKFGLEAGLTLFKNVSIWVGADYLSKKGGLTVTDDATQVWLMPVSAGLRYESPAAKWLLLHLAAGVQEVFFKEDSSLGTTKKNALGFTARAGAVLRLSKALGIDLFAGWSTCKMKNGDIEFKVGGLDLGGGVEIRF
jgi:hypothetical protein